MRYLQTLGYRTMRAPASLGVWDVIAWRADLPGLTAVQVKANKPPGPAERARMAADVLPWGSTRLIVVWKDYARVPIITELEVPSNA